MDTPITEQEQISKYRELVKEIRTCVLITNGKDGKLKGRPMATAGLDHDNSLWFFTNEFSAKSAEIEADSQVMLSYSNAKDNHYLTVSGTAIVSEDKAVMTRLFTPMVKVWFPEGLDDPKLALLKVTPNEIEYWENTTSKIVILFQMLKSIITGQEYKEGEHGTIAM